MSTIETPRLALVAMAGDVLGASLDRDLGEVERLLGAAVPPDWPPHPEVFALRLARLEIEPALAPWLTRVIVERAAEGGRPRAVGITGFHGPPGGDWLAEYAPGGVEFGYTVFADYRRRGIATESGRALIDWAHAGHGVTQFVLSMAPDNEASQGVARKLGFERVGSWQHEERGLEWVFRLACAPGRAG